MSKRNTKCINTLQWFMGKNIDYKINVLKNVSSDTLGIIEWNGESFDFIPVLYNGGHLRKCNIQIL